MPAKSIYIASITIFFLKILATDSNSPHTKNFPLRRPESSSSETYGDLSAHESSPSNLSDKSQPIISFDDVDSADDAAKVQETSAEENYLKYQGEINKIKGLVYEIPTTSQAKCLLVILKPGTKLSSKKVKSKKGISRYKVSNYHLEGFWICLTDDCFNLFKEAVQKSNNPETSSGDLSNGTFLSTLTFGSNFGGAINSQMFKIIVSGFEIHNNKSSMNMNTLAENKTRDGLGSTGDSNSEESLTSEKFENSLGQARHHSEEENEQDVHENEYDYSLGLGLDKLDKEPESLTKLITITLPEKEIRLELQVASELGEPQTELSEIDLDGNKRRLGIKVSEVKFSDNGRDTTAVKLLASFPYNEQLESFLRNNSKKIEFSKMDKLKRMLRPLKGLNKNSDVNITKESE